MTQQQIIDLYSNCSETFTAWLRENERRLDRISNRNNDGVDVYHKYLNFKRFTEEKILCLLNENQDHFKLAQEIEDNMNQFILKYELPENIMKMIEDVMEFIKKV